MLISAFMKSLFRIIALWLVLVALPFQGFASASMLRYGDFPAGQTASAHAAVDDDSGDHCAGGTWHCVTGDCCVGAALAYALPQPTSQPQRAERLRLSEPMPPPTVDLALPKRPPRAILA